jgi:aspartyl-tRNA(Asn)/glutamyl-tRNA(Gln) amidotransferase subunit A
MVSLAEGTDGAGSIRIPASFCGVVGFKPTFGRVPRFPIPDQYNTLSHTGPIAASVADAALFLDVLAGPDWRDPLCLTDHPSNFEEAIHRAPSLATWRIGFSQDLGYANVDPAVSRTFAKTLERLEWQGARIEESDPGHVDPEPILLRMWEVSYAARFGEKYEQQYPRMGKELKSITQAGFRPEAWRLGVDAQERSRLFACYNKYFGRYDLLLTPTLPLAAFDLARQRPPGREETLFGWTPFTYPYNLTGLPALTLPMGVDGDGLPLGLQIIGRRGADNTVLQAGHVIEAILKDHLGRPWTVDGKN